nr:monofunctional riboflavin biosynthesis protein RIBA 3, chloroplastic [Tanacetum cinerariifolium]
MDDSISNPKRRYRHASPNDYAAKYLTGIYGNDIRMLGDIGVQTMRLMSNNPAKFTGLKGYGLAIVEWVPGDIGNGRDVLVRVHSECLTRDIFGSGHCDCGNQLAMAMQIIEESGDIGVQTMRLMSNNPAKFAGLKGYDRAKTILALASPTSGPGHVFSLKYWNGGVLRLAGHTEASVDLVKLVGLDPVSILSTIVNPEDGSIAPLNKLRKLELDHGIPLVLIADLIRYRSKRERLVERVTVSRLPTTWGLFEAYCYRSKLDRTEHIAVVKGDIGNGRDVLVRVHSECLTRDIFGGTLIYLRGHEGRGIGLGHKLRAYNLQDLGHDTVEANLELGFAPESREYGIEAQMLRDIGVQTMRLMSNNPAKFTGLKGYENVIIYTTWKITAINVYNKMAGKRSRTTVEEFIVGIARPYVRREMVPLGGVVLDEMLRDIGVHTMRLMSNNPAKFIGLKGYDLAIVERVPVMTPITDENRSYLETKRTKMGHIYGSDIPGALDFKDMPNIDL